MKLTFEFLKKEICKRDDAKGTGYDLRANHVSACIKHFEDILAENLADFVWEGNDKRRPLLFQFTERIARKTQKIEKARKSKRPDKKGSKS